MIAVQQEKVNQFQKWATIVHTGINERGVIMSDFHSVLEPGYVVPGKCYTIRMDCDSGDIKEHTGFCSEFVSGNLCIFVVYDPFNYIGPLSLSPSYICSASGLNMVEFTYLGVGSTHGTTMYIHLYDTDVTDHVFVKRLE